MNDPKHDDGGPAFPQHGWTGDPIIRVRMKESGLGMTLLDHFAGKAIEGFMSSPAFQLLRASCGDNDAEAAELAAGEAYFLAAAMVAQKRRLEGKGGAS